MLAMSQPTKWSQFGTLISVFFFWGFVAASNDILIPVFKNYQFAKPHCSFNWESPEGVAPYCAKAS